MYDSNTSLLITLSIGGFSKPIQILYFLHVIEIVIIILFKEWSNIIVLERKEIYI